MAKFGILGCFYGCEDRIESVIKPFEGKSDLLLAATSCPFEGFPDLGRGDVIPKLGCWEYVYSSEVPMKESEARNMPLNFLLFNDVDWIWLLDGDEVYTEEQISSIKAYVEKVGHGNWFFSLNFKNIVFDGSSWIDGFQPPRIFSNRIHGGIKEFYWDNDIVYEDGTNYKSLTHINVPKIHAHINHYTWLNNDLGRRKVEYQKTHFGHCSYKWNDQKEALEFDEEFHVRHGLEIPKLNKL